MTSKQRQKIINANLKLAQKEADIFDQIHPEIFCEQSQKQLQKVMTVAFEKLKDKGELNALDLGCGTGNLTMQLLQNKNIKKITVVDLSAPMLGKLRQKLSISQKDKINFFISEADEFLKEDDKKYNLICAGSLLSYLPDYEMTIKRIIRKLKPGGVLIIHQEPIGKTSRALQRLEQKDHEKFIKKIKDQALRSRVKKISAKTANYHKYKNSCLEDLIDLFAQKTTFDLEHCQKYNSFKNKMSCFWGSLVSSKNHFSMVVVKK